jgi:hypothetical protein
MVLGNERLTEVQELIYSAGQPGFVITVVTSQENV